MAYSSIARATTPRPLDPITFFSISTFPRTKATKYSTKREKIKEISFHLPSP